METRAMEHPSRREGRTAPPPTAMAGDHAPRAARRGHGRRWLRLLLASMLVVVAAPACRSASNAEPGKAPAEQPRTTVKVENRSFLDHNVYVLRGGQRVRLGMVTGNSTQTFTIPANLVFGVTALSFLVDPIGGTRQPVSNELPVSAGDEVQLIIPPGL